VPGHYGRMQARQSPVIWGAIVALVVVAVLLAVFGGTIGAVIVAVVAIGLALFSSGRRRG
jgi:multisubunit Na+/H+ antiporter MnhG subunit